MSDVSQEVTFNGPLKTQTQNQVQLTLQQNISKMVYEHNEAQTLTNRISDQVLKWLTQNNKNFKFIVNCIIMQKAESGLNISGSCYWDNDTDGSLTVKHETDSLISIVNVFACAL